MAIEVSDEDAAAERARGHLEANAVGFLGPLMQSVGDIGPTGSIALGLPLVAVIAGGAAWLSWLLCSIAVLCIAYSCAQIAKKYSTTAGLAGLSVGAGSPAIGVATSLCVMGFYILITPTNLIGDAYLFQDWFGTIDVGYSRWLLFLIGLAILAFSVYLPLRGIRVAATALLVGEGVTIILAIMLMVAILVNHPGQIFDSSQLTLHGLSVHEVLFGVAVGIFGFAGFETSATLGKETRDPHKNIPRSLYSSVIVCGLIFVLAAYILDLGFHGSKLTLATSSSPLADVARLNGVGWLASPLTFGVALSILGATMASVNSGARYLLTLTRDGLVPGPIGRYFSVINDKTHVPSRIIWWWGAAYPLVCWIILIVSGAATIAVWGNLATAFTLMYVGAYITALFAMLLYGGRIRRWLLPVAAVIGIGLLGYGVYNSVYPAPDYPANVYTYTGTGVIVLACLIAIVLKLTRSRVLKLEGSSISDPAAADATTPAA